MSDRVAVVKTCKLFIGGAFPRSESGRAVPVHGAAARRQAARRARSGAGAGGSAGGRGGGGGTSAEPAPIAYVSQASRKDLRDAVEAAAKAQPGWAARDATNRGQILYRLAEMIEDRREAFAGALREVSGATAAVARREIDASIDRLVSYAGWTDKYQSLLGTHDPVSGPYYAFTVPEATGVVVAFVPPEPALLGLVQLAAAAICTGNAVVAVVPVEPGGGGGNEDGRARAARGTRGPGARGSSSRSRGTPPVVNPLPAVQLAETCNVSDVPPGVVNVLTAVPTELVPHVALHRGVDAVAAASAGLSHEDVAALRAGAAENLKRVHVETADGARWFDHEAMATPWSLEPFVEMKTIWHPSAI